MPNDRTETTARLPQDLRALGYPVCDRAADEIERLADEIERLRAALFRKGAGGQPLRRIGRAAVSRGAGLRMPTGNGSRDRRHMSTPDRTPTTDRDKLLARIRADAAAGFDGNEGAGVVSFYTKRDAVFAAVRQADHRYDGAAPDSQGITRPEYVGRAALIALNSEVLSDERRTETTDYPRWKSQAFRDGVLVGFALAIFPMFVLRFAGVL